MPCVQQPDLSPVPRGRDLGIGFCNCISSFPEPTQSFNAPASEGLDRERDKTASRKSPCRVPAMFPLGRTSSRRAVPVRRRMEMGSPLWVRDDDVPVDQGIRRGTRKTAIEPGFLQLQFPLRVGPPTGPGRLEHLRRGGIPCSPANPSEDVPELLVFKRGV